MRLASNTRFDQLLNFQMAVTSMSRKQRVLWREHKDLSRQRLRCDPSLRADPDQHSVSDDMVWQLQRPRLLITDRVGTRRALMIDGGAGASIVESSIGWFIKLRF